MMASSKSSLPSEASYFQLCNASVSITSLSPSVGGESILMERERKEF
jgi:hypothetical protein